MIACLSFSHNAQIVENNLTTSSTDFWSHVLTVYLVWSNSRFLWCYYDCGTSSNTFIGAFKYSNDCR
jgi:hypothetical protein